jgi:hypothetical protein
MDANQGMINMIDLGISKGTGKSNTENYTTKYLNELSPEDTITGEIYVGDIKKRTIKKTEVNEFYVIITDHKNTTKWVCGLITSYYHESGNIYGEKGGRIYALVDSINNALNGSELNQLEKYNANFDTFQNNINNKVKEVTAKIVKATNPNSKSHNLTIIKAEELPPEEWKSTNRATAEDQLSEEKSQPKIKPIAKRDPKTYDDEQAKEWIRDICEVTKLAKDDYDNIAKAVKKRAEEWELSPNDVTRILNQLAAYQFNGIRG